MTPQQIDLYRAIQDRRGEWKEDDKCWHRIWGFGTVHHDLQRTFGVIRVKFKSSIGTIEFKPDDPDLLWIPPPTPMHPDDKSGRNLWDMVDWEKYRIYSNEGEGGMVTMFLRGENSWVPICHDETLPEALLRAIGGKGETIMKRRPMSQSWHEKYNATHYPGTRQLCIDCNEPTERCEDDAIYTDDGYGPLCLDCYHKHEQEPGNDRPIAKGGGA